MTQFPISFHLPSFPFTSCYVFLTHLPHHLHHTTPPHCTPLTPHSYHTTRYPSHTLTAPLTLHCTPLTPHSYHTTRYPSHTLTVPLTLRYAPLHFIGCNACRGSPNSAPSAINVGATDIEDKVSYFSDIGTYVLTYIHILKDKYTY